MSPVVAGKLIEFAKDAAQIVQGYEYDQWSARVRAFLTQALGMDEAFTFANLSQSLDRQDWPEALAMGRGHLEGLVEKPQHRNKKPR